MPMRIDLSSGTADVKCADRKAAPSENSRGLANAIVCGELRDALAALERISGNQRALTYVAKNGGPELGERAVEMLSGMLPELTEVGAILAVALHSKDVDAKAKASAMILNLGAELVYRKPKKELTEDDFAALNFIAEKHPDEMLRRLADCKLPIPSRVGGVEFNEQVFDAGRLAEILEMSQV